MVAVRGLVRSLHSHFGFEPRNAMLAGYDLSMAGYSGDRVPTMQKRMIEALETIPGVKSVGLADVAAVGMTVRTDRMFLPTRRRTCGHRTRPPKPFDVQHISRILPRSGHSFACRAGLLHGMTTRTPHAWPMVNQEFAVESSVPYPTRWADTSRCRMERAYKWWVSSEDGKYIEPHRSSAAGDVSSHPAITLESDIGGCALGPRSNRWRPL